MPAARQQRNELRICRVVPLRHHQRSATTCGSHIQARAGRKQRAAAVRLADKGRKMQGRAASIIECIHLVRRELEVAWRAEQAIETAQMAKLSCIVQRRAPRTV